MRPCPDDPAVSADEIAQWLYETQRQTPTPMPKTRRIQRADLTPGAVFDYKHHPGETGTVGEFRPKSDLWSGPTYDTWEMLSDTKPSGPRLTLNAIRRYYQFPQPETPALVGTETDDETAN